MDRSISGVPLRVTKWTIIVVLISVGLVGYGGYDYVQQSQAVEDAVAVEATVIDTSLSEDSGRRGTSYTVDVEFSYEYQGTNYTSDLIYPRTDSESYEDRSEANATLETYEPGTPTTAYLDPDAPSDGFLNKQTADDPLWLIGFGLLLFVVQMLHDVGVKTPAETELQPESKYEQTPYQTIFGVDQETVHRTSKRLIAGSMLVFVGSLLGILGIMGVKFLTAGGYYSWGSVGVTHPLGLLFVGGGLGVLGLVGSLLLYVGWSYTEYRRLRARLAEPRPPSPFRHPTRLEAILSMDDDELGEYHTRVKYTAFAFLIAVFFSLFVVVVLL